MTFSEYKFFGIRSGGEVRWLTKNVASQKVLEKVGFKREGTLRKTYLLRGEWTDIFIFSILREEWIEPRTLQTLEQRSSLG